MAKKFEVSSGGTIYDTNAVQSYMLYNKSGCYKYKILLLTPTDELGS